MPVYQAKFTPTGEAAVSIMIFKYLGTFKTQPYYDETINQGLKGNYRKYLGEKSREYNIPIIVEAAAEATLITYENLKGVLNLRGVNISDVRLLSIERVQAIDVASQSIVSGVLNITHNYYEVNSTWCKEAP